MRILAATRWTRNLLCQDRQAGQAAVVREIRPAVWWHGSERRLALVAMRREAEILAAVGKAPGEPLFPRLLAACLEGTAPWIAVEFLEGSTLRGLFPTGLDGRVLAERGWTVPQALQAILSLRAGLSALHKLGEVHGFIHPGNLVVEAEGGEDAARVAFRLRLRDLGWAGVPRGQTLVAGRECLPYVSPLALQSAGPPGPEADAWSAAVILFELMAGRPAFGGDPSRLEHEERFAVRRRMARGLPPGLPAQLPRELLAFFESSLSAPEAVNRQEAGGEPLGEFFTRLSRCLDVAERDELWSQARLPNPDLERLRQEIPSRRLPVSSSLLEQHEILWGRWRSATRQMLEGFSHLAHLPGSGPWPGWRQEIDGDAAACIQREPKDDPDRDDSEALAGRLQQIEERLRRLTQISAEAWQILMVALGKVADDLDAAARDQAAALARKDPALTEAIQTFRRETDRCSRERMTPDRFPSAARLTNDGERLRGRLSEALAQISAETEKEAANRALLQRRQEARTGFWKSVRRGAWTEAASILASWPGGGDDESRDLGKGLSAWQRLVMEAEALLEAERTPDTLVAIDRLARRLNASTPSAFEEVARDLAGRLSKAKASARGVAPEEEAPRPVTRRIPEPPPKRRPWIPLAAAGVVVVASVILWPAIERAVRGIIQVVSPSPKKTVQVATATPTPIPILTPVASPTPTPPLTPADEWSEAWIHGPALARLTLVLEREGSEIATASLPGSVRFPKGQNLMVRLTWDESGLRQADVAIPDGAALQRKVTELLADAPMEPTRSGTLDREVARWVEGILQEGR